MRTLENHFDNEIQILQNKREENCDVLSEENCDTLYICKKYREHILKIAVDACTKGGYSGCGIQFVFGALRGLTLKKVLEKDIAPDSILRDCFDSVYALAQTKFMNEDVFKHTIEVTVKVCNRKPLSELTYDDDEFYLAETQLQKSDFQYYINKRNSQVFMRKYPDGTKIVNVIGRYLFRNPEGFDIDRFFYVNFLKGGYCRVLDYENKEQPKKPITFFNDYVLHSGEEIYARIKDINDALYDPTIKGEARSLLFFELNELEDEYQKNFGVLYDLIESLAESVNYMHHLFYPVNEQDEYIPVKDEKKLIEDGRKQLQYIISHFHRFHREHGITNQ